ncbi:hypothetical protein M8C21_005797, partial [Ambrosia artemisiifolia]
AATIDVEGFLGGHKCRFPGKAVAENDRPSQVPISSKVVAEAGGPGRRIKRTLYLPASDFFLGFHLQKIIEV